MSPKQWLALFCFYMAYLLFGATFFYHTQHPLEIEDRIHNLQERIEIYELLSKYISPEDEAKVLERVSDYCGKKVTDHKLDENEDPFKWTFYHSFYLSFIICSTIGYGNISPSIPAGKIFLIFYALIGMPVHGFVFAQMGNYFATKITRLYDRYKVYKIHKAQNQSFIAQKFRLLAKICLYVVPGIVLLVFIPSIIFSHFEDDWSYITSIYYSFVTLTTIGFGDYVTTFGPNQEREFGIAFVFYKIFILVWFTIGIAFFWMILTFIAKGLASKRIRNLEHQLSNNLKATQNRIWSGVTKDIGYLRRVLNELYVMKVSPVYTDDTEREIWKIPRSASCPDLTMYRSGTPTICRKRAFSECFIEPQESITPSNLSLFRRSSDTEIDRIDKAKTFAQAKAYVQSGDLIADVVSALGSIRASENDVESIAELSQAPTTNAGDSGGIDLFSDAEILANELTWSGWSIPDSDLSNIIAKRRSRATSEVKFPKLNDAWSNGHEWTWSGNNQQIQKMLSEKNNFSKENNGNMKSQQLNSDKSITISIPMPTDNKGDSNLKHRSNEDLVQVSNDTLMDKFNRFRKRASLAIPFINSNIDKEREKEKEKPTLYSSDPPLYEEQQTPLPRHRARSHSIMHYYNANTAIGRNSVFSLHSNRSNRDASESDILENTTLADLIRALEIVHMKANTTGEVPQITVNDMESNGSETPKRKNGVPNLMPTSMRTRSPSLSVAELFRTKQQGRAPNFGSNRFQRRQSIASNSPLSLSSKLALNLQPPSYSSASTPSSSKRRFSVRPTNLGIPIGQAPPSSSTGIGSSPALVVQPSSTALQRKLSLRPGPFQRDGNLNMSMRSGRYSSNPTQRFRNRAQSIAFHQNRVGRMAQSSERLRHGSLVESPTEPIGERKRTESK